jgi:hypothetical protein
MTPSRQEREADLAALAGLALMELQATTPMSTKKKKWKSLFPSLSGANDQESPDENVDANVGGGGMSYIHSLAKTLLERGAKPVTKYVDDVTPKPKSKHILIGDRVRGKIDDLLDDNMTPRPKAVTEPDDHARGKNSSIDCVVDDHMTPRPKEVAIDPEVCIPGDGAVQPSSHAVSTDQNKPFSSTSFDDGQPVRTIQETADEASRRTETGIETAAKVVEMLPPPAKLQSSSSVMTLNEKKADVLLTSHLNIQSKADRLSIFKNDSEDLTIDFSKLHLQSALFGLPERQSRCETKLDVAVEDTTTANPYQASSFTNDDSPSVLMHDNPESPLPLTSRQRLFCNDRVLDDVARLQIDSFATLPSTVPPTPLSVNKSTDRTAETLVATTSLVPPPPLCSIEGRAGNIIEVQSRFIATSPALPPPLSTQEERVDNTVEPQCTSITSPSDVLPTTLTIENDKQAILMQSVSSHPSLIKDDQKDFSPTDSTNPFAAASIGLPPLPPKPSYQSTIKPSHPADVSPNKDDKTLSMARTPVAAHRSDITATGAAPPTAIDLNRFQHDHTPEIPPPPTLMNAKFSLTDRFQWMNSPDALPAPPSPLFLKKK